MERRVLVAVFLSFLVLYAYQALLVPPAPPPEEQAARAPAPAAEAPGPGPGPRPAEPSAAEQAPVPQPESVLGDVAEREIVVETAKVEAVLSNRGGRLVRWRLKEYRDDGGEPVDLVPSSLPPDQPTPLLLRVEDEAVTRRLNTALYRVSQGDGRVDARAQPASVVFEFEDASGLRARKEIRFEPANYVVTISATVTDRDRTLNPAVLWGPGLGDLGATTAGGSFFTGNYVQPPGAIYHRDGDVERLGADGLAEQPAHEGQFRFAGIDDHYFIAAAINPGQARLEFRPAPLAAPGGAQRQFVSYSISFPEAPRDARFFFGPKQFDVLRDVDPELVRAINFGIFAWLAVPLLGALTWIYGIVGNYGWSIVLLTLLINAALFPLRHKSAVSMRKMQQLQPQMKAIQARYAGLKVTDPARQKMNTEIMNLYREKGVNPASGCVPMILMMPVLLAFYSLLSQAIELRGAEFGWWIKDLSQHDPYYVTPLLMGGSMFWQQRLTPTTADPTQQRVMMIMPIMFTFMFLRVPSGLVVYWLVSNLWAIGQQYFTNWMLGPPAVQTARPPAERRVKSVGAGRTTDASKPS